MGALSKSLGRLGRPRRSPPSGRWIKTDRRDALLVAHAARVGELVNLKTPDERDRANATSAAHGKTMRARLKARKQLEALLLRHGRRYSSRSS